MISARRTRGALMLVAVAVLSGCAAPQLAPPKLELPEMTAQATEKLDRWWTLFEEPELDALVHTALAANLDLRSAVARIDEARALARLAGAERYPSLDLHAGVNRNRVSAANTRSLPPPLATKTHDLGLQAAYELDLWGRLASGEEAARASLEASRFAADTLRITLAAEVARNYFSLRAVDDEIRLTRASLATREENVRLLARRRDSGLAGDFEFKLADAERAGVATALPALDRARALGESALAVLLGGSAKAVFSPATLASRSTSQAVIPEVPSGLPSDLLARRPDIRGAEASLAAADARIAEARARFYPRLSLTASLGGESAAFADLLTSPARVWSVAGALLQPIIGLSQIRFQVDVAVSRREQALIAYQRAVQAAFRDVHDALVAHRAAREGFAAQAQRRALLQEVMRLAELRHINGYSSYLEVLDAQRNLLDAERGELSALRDRRIALVDLYKALGGGWEPPPAADKP